MGALGFLGDLVSAFTNADNVRSTNKSNVEMQRETNAINKHLHLYLLFRLKY